MPKKPLIGAYTRFRNFKKPTPSFPGMLRENYCSSISNFGGIPIPLVYDNKSINSILDIIDGLVITGGAFDIDPKYYSEYKYKIYLLKIKELNMK